MGRRQSGVQVLALLLLLSALVIGGIVKMEWILLFTSTLKHQGNDKGADNTATTMDQAQHFTHGRSILLAGFISGLRGAITKNLQAWH
jgi:hypothetical protein